MRARLPAALLLLAGCASAPRQPPPPPAPPGAPEVRAVRVSEPIIVDGVDNDAAWRECPETVIPFPCDGAPNSFHVKAVVCRGSLYFLVSWAVTTPKRFVGGFYTGPREIMLREWVGDQLIVALALAGSIPRDGADPTESLQDIWRWDADGSDTSGHADDGTFSHRFVGPDDAYLYITQLPDGRVLGERFQLDAGRATPPTGSAADVLARGKWREGAWTVEFGRALFTGHSDDTDLLGLSEIQVRLSLHFDRGFSPVLRLLLPPPESVPPAPLPEPLGPPATGR